MKKIEKVIQLFEKNKREMEKMLNVKLNYFPQSVKNLEVELNKMYPFGRNVSSSISLMVGVYLGETIRKNVKNAIVEWGEDTQYAIETELSFKKVKLKNDLNETDFVIKPILRVEKFLNQDRTDSLWAMYCMCQDICQSRISLNPDEKWRKSMRGYNYRAFEADKEQY